MYNHECMYVHCTCVCVHVHAHRTYRGHKTSQEPKSKLCIKPSCLNNRKSPSPWGSFCAYLEPCNGNSEGEIFSYIWIKLGNQLTQWMVWYCKSGMCGSTSVGSALENMLTTCGTSAPHNGTAVSSTGSGEVPFPTPGCLTSDKLTSFLTYNSLVGKPKASFSIKTIGRTRMPPSLLPHDAWHTRWSQCWPGMTRQTVA